MAAMDKLLQKIQQHNAERVVLCNDQPIRLFAAGREASGSVLGAAQLRSMIQEVTPPELRSQLTYKSSFQFPYSSQQGIFNFSIVNGNGALQVTITPHRADLINFVDVDSLNFSFDSPTQTPQPPISNFPPANSNKLADHVEKIKPSLPASTKSTTPPADNQARKKSAPTQRNNEKCGYCKTHISDEVESIPMHRGTENRIIMIPRCAQCRKEQEKVSPIDGFYMVGGCLGSIVTTAIYFMFVYSYMVAHFSPRANAFIGLIFIFSPYILWMIADGNITGHTKHPDYISAQEEGFTNNLHRP